jgi:hypothetical protein
MPQYRNKITNQLKFAFGGFFGGKLLYVMGKTL